MDEFDAYRIPSQDLREGDVPGSQAAWEVIRKFALLFDGYGGPPYVIIVAMVS